MSDCAQMPPAKPDAPLIELHASVTEISESRTKLDATLRCNGRVYSTGIVTERPIRDSPQDELRRIVQRLFDSIP